MTETGEGRFQGAGGGLIVWQSWSPAGDQQPKGVVTIAHGYGEHIGRYRYVAERLCEAGFLVYGPDHHGHGLSDGERGRIVLADAVADVDQLITTVARKRNPGAAQFLLGHSMGGLIGLEYAAAHQERLTGLALTGPLAAVEGGPALHALARALGVILPGVPVSRVDPEFVSQDPAVVSAYRADPLNYHGPVRARVAREFILATEALPALVAGIKLPVLLQWGTDDRICPPEGSEMVAERIGSRDLSLERWPGAFHEILNEPERDRVLDVLVAWLSAHAG